MFLFLSVPDTISSPFQFSLRFTDNSRQDAHTGPVVPGARVGVGAGRVAEHDVGHQLQLGVRLPELRELVELPGIQTEQHQQGGDNQRHDSYRVPR